MVQNVSAGGRSNSRPRKRHVTQPFAISDCGVDTVSFAWRPVRDRDWWRELAAAVGQGSLTLSMPLDDDGPELRRSKRGMFVSRQKLAGGHVVVAPGSRFIAVEGRLMALLEGSDEASGLAPVAWLELAAERWANVLAAAELDIRDARPVLRRIDLAVDVRFEMPAAGLSLLEALAAASAERPFKLAPWRGCEWETVSLVHCSGRVRRVEGRVYDRGVMTGEHVAGRLLRFERELRFKKGAQRPLPDVRWNELSGEPFGWLGSVKAPAPMGSTADAAERLLGLVESGELGVEAGIRLLGSLVLREHRDWRSWWTAYGKLATGRKHDRELRRLGVLAESAPVAPPMLDDIRRAADGAWASREACAEVLTP